MMNNMSEVIQKGTYSIVCSKCRNVLYGPAEGSLEAAFAKRNQMVANGELCPNGCANAEFQVHFNHEIRKPKYDAEHPYYPQ